jgi:hypothetical protein
MPPTWACCRKRTARISPGAFCLAGAGEPAIALTDVQLGIERSRFIKRHGRRVATWAELFA